jgi:hypothetical protein
MTWCRPELRPAGTIPPPASFRKAIVNTETLTAARGEIADLRHRYCWAYDAGEPEALGDLFTADGLVNLGDWGLFRGTAEIVEGFRRQVTPPGEPRTTLHTVTTEVIDVDGDTARGSWCVVVYHPPQGDDVHPIRFVGRYLDTYRHEGERWLLTSIRLEEFWFAGY